MFPVTREERRRNDRRRYSRNDGEEGCAGSAFDGGVIFRWTLVVVLVIADDDLGTCVTKCDNYAPVACVLKIKSSFPHHFRSVSGLFFFCIFEGGSRTPKKTKMSVAIISLPTQRCPPSGRCLSTQELHLRSGHFFFCDDRL